MKKILSLLLPLVFFAGCAPFLSPPKVDITQLERTTFADLVLEPAHDLYDYRYDVIRQTEEVGDSCTTTEDVPYHRLGMRLGNGLFYDLNGNLTVDLFTLLSLPERGNFAVVRTNLRRPKLARNIRVANGSYCEEFFPAFSSKKRWDCREYDHHTNRITVNRNNRFCFTIEEDMEGIRQLNRRGRVVDQIVEIETGVYTDRLRRKTDDFVQLENEILAKNYRIALNERKDEILIYQQRFLRERLVKRIIKTKDRLYILDKNDWGREIQVMDNQLIIKPNRRDQIVLEVVREGVDFDSTIGK